ncbi:MFS transporter [Levilactobacillus acidifarinae]|uniref:MFS family major facilitator transporter n=1 Tax=Levilactobacillus acidifarinae DSM 19394 = JCM 15949 TaxID=1423715 RepID=A0A0R1LSQ8_9LACO|nr:MFS transporter [Levilactobacillus acidifarinae]KRK95833.1 MFS family major facilitator transporter [Levilactobacillus acidifarinae DSM 19394]GEO69132.1 MFS transporter [Levilactobacillus acidifarinae]
MEAKEQNVVEAKRGHASLATAIYINYAILSIAQILISQYSSRFQAMWSTDLRGISTVISMMGIGRIITILFAGDFSDRFGRKPVLITGMVANFVFLVGLIFSTNMLMAAIFSLFLGFANSFDDAAAYPALSEAFPTKSASMSSLVKAAMSLAQFVLPFVVATIPNATVTLVILSVIILIDVVMIFVSKFAPQNTNEAPTEEASSDAATAEATTQTTGVHLPKMKIDGISLIALGFTISFTFYVYTQYIPNFGSSVLGLSEVAAKSLMSWYAIFSLISVFITTVLVTKLKPIFLVILYPLISVVFLVLMVMFPSVIMAKVTSAVIGFFAAGGVWQLGLAVLTQYFPQKKGKVTGYYSFAAAMTYFVGPFVSSFIINSTASSVLEVFWIDIAVTVVGVLLATFVQLRNQKYKFN